MPTPVESALSTLLPTASYLPPELIALSNSLLAQSRSRAGSLRPEEEIGRTYACCHIACERLSKNLGLDISRPVPPVKPRLYTKLKGYLETALKNVGSGSTTPRTPGGRTRDALKTPTKQGTDETPAKTRSAPRSQASTSKALQTPNVEEVPLPKWVRGMIRAICAHYKTPDVAPHILAGITSILKRGKPPSSSNQDDQPPPSKRKRGTPSSHKSSVDYLADDMLPMLIGLLHVAIRARMSLGSVNPDDDEQGFRNLYDRSFNMLMLFIIDYYDNNTQLFADGPNAATIDQAMGHWAQQAESVWPDMEWYLNVPCPDATREDVDGQAEGGAMEEDAGERSDEVAVDRRVAQRSAAKTPLRRKEKHGRARDGESGDAEEAGRAGLLPGLATMFQPAVDWLSDERCEQYAEWKAHILRELAIVEKRQGMPAVITTIA